MEKKSQMLCQICKKKYDTTELFPIALIRGSILNLAVKKYPNLENNGLICVSDLRKMSAMHFENILKKKIGGLSPLENEVLESIKEHEILSENTNEEFEEKSTFGEKLADKISRFGGSWAFISFFLIVLLGWIGINSLQFLQMPFDPYPFILLNLVLSSLAAVQAPIIMMSQNRQASKDRLNQENDYQINLKSELQIRQLNTRLELFMKDQWQTMHEITSCQDEILHVVNGKKKIERP